MVNRILIKVILVFLLVAANFYLIYLSSEADCTKCNIVFRNTKQFGQLANQTIIFNMTDLYNQSLGGRCPVSWSRTHGYTTTG